MAAIYCEYHLSKRISSKNGYTREKFLFVHINGDNKLFKIKTQEMKESILESVGNEDSSENFQKLDQCR